MIDLETTRALVRRTRPACRRDGYPLEVRSRVVQLARERRASGGSLVELARDLDLSVSTVTRWLDSEPVPVSPWLPVEVSAPGRAHGPAGALRLVAPSGFALEGLDLETAMFLLERWS